MDAAPTAPVSASLAAGYRVVRVLGEGTRTTVHLGYASSAEEGEPADVVALRVYRQHVPIENVDAEVRALVRLDHPHLARLVDLATSFDGRPCLVLERLEPVTLARVLAQRSGITVGEAVTILAPLAGALDAMHAAGVLHGGLRASRVLFRASGAAVICGFGQAALIAPGQSAAALDAIAGVAEDRRQLLLLAAAVLERVPGGNVAEVREALATGELPREVAQPTAGGRAVGSTPMNFGARLAELLFDLGEPQPVHLARSDPPGDRIRIRGAAVPTAEPTVGDRSHRRDRPVSSLRARLLESPIVALPQVAWPAVIARASRMPPRLWFVAGAVALSVVVALTLIPTGEHTSPSASVSVAATPSGSQPAGVATTLPTDDDATALTGDDPVAALVVLLERRQRCLAELSVLCLDSIAQANSAALDGDAHAVRALQSGELTVPQASIVANVPMLVERLGDSALVSLGEVPETQPASALMMRDEAGWRIRNYLND